MTINPTLILDENDLKPFIDAFKKQLREENKEFVIQSIVPLALGDGHWQVEIKAAPVTTEGATNKD